MSNLQLFTEPGGDGGGSEGGDGAGAGGNPGNNNNTTMSFDEFLALEGNQSEFDRRVQKAVNMRRQYRIRMMSSSPICRM